MYVYDDDKIICILMLISAVWQCGDGGVAPPRARLPAAQRCKLQCYANSAAPLWHANKTDEKTCISRNLCDRLADRLQHKLQVTHQASKKYIELPQGEHPMTALEARIKVVQQLARVHHKIIPTHQLMVHISGHSGQFA